MNKEESNANKFVRENKHIFAFAMLFLFAMSIAFAAARLPTVSGDSGSWGTVLNDYLGVGHNESGHHNESLGDSLLTNMNSSKLLEPKWLNNDIMLDAANITAGIFPSGNFIFTGGNGKLLNVNSSFYVNGTTGYVGIGTASPNINLNVVGSVNISGNVNGTWNGAIITSALVGSHTHEASNITAGTLGAGVFNAETVNATTLLQTALLNASNITQIPTATAYLGVVKQGTWNADILTSAYVLVPN